jgi:hypothetical protein
MRLSGLRGESSWLGVGDQLAALTLLHCALRRLTSARSLKPPARIAPRRTVD